MSRKQTIIKDINACHSGRPMATPTGIAPRSSIRGTIEIKNTLRYFVSI